MSKPFVIKNVINGWPAMDWTPDMIAESLGEKLVRIRLGPKKHIPGTVLFETDSIFIQTTLIQFLAWFRGDQNSNSMDGPFAKFDRKDYWGYVDYKYMFELFDDPDQQKFLEAIDWGVFGCGLEERNGLDSTFWMGTKGAYTPCHYDTYGFNLVAQLFGRKRWALFPPTDDLNSTRFPYEESSVFSSLDFVTPDESSLRRTHPHLITLEAGDVLFVPPKWWHFVQSMDDMTISANTWVDTPALDGESKSMEALTQVIMSVLADSKSCGSIEKFIIGDANIGDLATDFGDQKAISADQSSKIADLPDQSLNIDNSIKQLNSVVDANEEDKEENTIMNDFLARWKRDGIIEAQQMTVDQFCRFVKYHCPQIITEPSGGQENLDLASGSEAEIFTKMDILKAMTHPDCVRVIYDRLIRMK